jgi:DNA-binding beta-propeller fold protein YncE
VAMRKLIPCLGVIGFALRLKTAAGAEQRKAIPKRYVTNSAGENMHVIDLRGFGVVGEIRTREHPQGAAVSADSRRFFTTVEGDQALHVLKTVSDQVIPSIKLSGLPGHGVAG